MLVVVVAVFGVTMTIVDVVDVAVVLQRVVPAVRAVDMVVRCGDGMDASQVVLVDVVVVLVVGVAIVQVVDVPIVLHRWVAAVGPVGVGVVFVDGAGGAHQRSDGRGFVPTCIVTSKHRDVQI